MAIFHANDDLQRIYAPENFKRLTSDHAKWGALLGLYTGARVGEVAQLYLRDFLTESGQPYVLIRVDSDGQSVKTESSERKVPLHPDLIELGLLRYIDRLNQNKAERLIPGMRIDGNAGSGGDTIPGTCHNRRLRRAQAMGRVQCVPLSSMSHR